MLLEKARQYATDCINCNEITTFEVKTQCEWFLEDLEKQKNESYPYYFDTKEIKIIEGILELLNYATGLNDIVGKKYIRRFGKFPSLFYYQYIWLEI